MDFEGDMVLGKYEALSWEHLREAAIAERRIETHRRQEALACLRPATAVAVLVLGSGFVVDEDEQQQQGPGNGTEEKGEFRR